MRSIFYGGALVAALIAGSLSASAQDAQGSGNGAYCAQTKSTESPQCLYRTMAACNEAVKDSQGICMRNPKLKK